MKRLTIPPTLHNYRAPSRVIERSRDFLRERGEHGVEGVALWLDEVVDDTTADAAAPLLRAAADGRRSSVDRLDQGGSGPSDRRGGSAGNPWKEVGPSKGPPGTADRRASPSSRSGRPTIQR
jgi:hypothetical protein